MMNQQHKKQCIIVLGFIFIFCLSISVPTVHAQMSHKEMLQKADEARGNAEGIQWEISMDSIEGGREQHRTLRVNA
ncbi:MAG: hypothetical protein WA096_11790, partial [Smithella sp.]